MTFVIYTRNLKPGEKREEKRLDFRRDWFQRNKKRRKPSKDKFDNMKRVARGRCEITRSIQTIRNAPRKWNYYSNFIKKREEGSIYRCSCVSFQTRTFEKRNEDFCRWFLPKVTGCPFFVCLCVLLWYLNSLCLSFLINKILLAADYAIY